MFTILTQQKTANEEQKLVKAAESTLIFTQVYDIIGLSDHFNSKSQKLPKSLRKTQRDGTWLQNETWKNNTILNTHNFSKHKKPKDRTNTHGF